MPLNRTIRNIFLFAAIALLCSIHFFLDKNVRLIQENSQEITKSSSSNNDAHDENMTLKPWRPIPDTNQIPILVADDIINREEYSAVIVNEEFKLIFFMVEEVVASDFKRFLMRLAGSPKEQWCGNLEDHGENIHESTHDGLKYLSDYPIKEAQKMMTSQDWTKAIFVGHPKLRVLSAFLDKVLGDSNHFQKIICKTYAENTGINRNECIRRNDFDFFVQKIIPNVNDEHWKSAYSHIDEKWWPWINFIGSLDNVNDDTISLLKGIKSVRDDVSAWDKLGKTGWSGQENNGECDGTLSFLEWNKEKTPKSNSNTKMLTYYTPQLEKYVEEYYANDLYNPYFHLDHFVLFEENLRKPNKWKGTWNKVL